MDHGILFILLVILIAYVFDFINGFHDAANAIAIIVTTGVLTPRQAVLWAAFFNFIAFLVFNLMVAKTIGTGLIDTSLMCPSLIFAALLGGIFWNLITWYFGLPSSSSHALIGGLAGAALVSGGWGALKTTGFIKVALGIFISPLVGLLLSVILIYSVSRCFHRRDDPMYHKMLSGLQLFSSALLSITHGGNDAQKTMGIIALLLFSASWTQDASHIPLWVVISCQAVISLGTLAGGWRIVYTMGQRITHLNPLRGSVAEMSAAAIIFTSTELGIPVSTTQTVTGAIVGVGLIHGFQSTYWPMVRVIFASWLLTLPAAGGLAALIFFIIH